MKIELQNISKAYGSTHVVQNVSLNIEENELFFLLGPSGCGKTTLLRILAGFVVPDSGNILFDGKRVNELPAEERCTPMVFQNYALWPHLNVFENVAYGLRVQGLSENEIQRRSKEALEITQMLDYENRFPNQLSGGQQQRIAISRALAVNPSVLLFDEPLSNLDAKLRIEMREELLEIHRRRPFTAIYVTHDQEEAMTMASRIAILEKGILHQVGSPQEIYKKSRNKFVAEFLGPMNWLAAKVQEIHEDQLTLDTSIGNLTIPRSRDVTKGQKVLVGFRPSSARLIEAKKFGDCSAKKDLISCEVIRAQYAGALQRIWLKPRCKIEGDSLQFQVIELNPSRMRKSGEFLELGIAPEDWMLLPSE